MREHGIAVVTDVLSPHECGELTVRTHVCPLLPSRLIHMCH
jgi:hypothetical protein